MNFRKIKTVLRQPNRASLPYIVLVACLLLTLIISFDLSRITQAEDRDRFRNSVQEIDSAIDARIATYVALLRAGTGLFAASESVEPGEFRSFVDHFELSQHYPGVQGIGFSLRLSPTEKDSFVEAVRRQGNRDFHIWPDGVRNEYHTIIYLEPQDRRNQSAIGYDMFTDPTRRAAMERARDTGLPAASGAVSLVQEIDSNKQRGFLIYAPVYRNGADVSTTEARRTALQGFVYSPFRGDDLLAAIPATRKYDNVTFQIYDGAPQPENLLNESSQFGVATPPGYQPRFIATVPITVAGQSWTLNFASNPKFDSASSVSLPYALASGIIISLIFFFLTRAQTMAGAAAESAAAELRKSEATIRKNLLDRERAEEALIESEERYRELVENANDIVYTLDLDGNLTSVNKAGEIITGYSRDELLNMNLRTLLTPESAAVSARMLDRTFAGQERTNYELDFEAKSGRVVALEISSRLVSKNGQPVEVQGIARDITVRRRAEEAMREADQRALSEYERLLERIASLAQTLGTARDLLTIFRGLREFVIVSVPCDGLFVSLYDPIRDVRTACYGWGDEQEFDVSDLPPMPVTTEGPNSRAIKTRQPIITDDYQSVTRGHPAVIMGPDNGMRPRSSLAIPMIVMGKTVGTIEVQSYEPAIYKENHVTALQMAANLTGIAIETVHLLERESSARATAEESNRLKDEFLAVVSHELRTPLTAILGWSRMLETGSLEDVTTQRAIETIRRNARAQSQIIDDILDVSRIVTGNLYLDLHPVELGPVVEAAVNVVRQTAEAKRIDIEVSLASSPALVSGDANRLQQVIWNLLSNAIKFTTSGGRVKLAVRQIDNQAEISVSDTGQGIAPDFLPFVFDRFRQADSTTTRRHGGLGLGLAIARHLVEIHGGTIHAESAGIGNGATFVIRLPLASSLTKADQSAETTTVSSRSALLGLHVLLVEDDPDTLHLLTEALRREQAQVTAVSSADDAIEALAVSSPDVLVSDIAMPGKDGYELIRRVKALSNARDEMIPAVAITAYAREEDRQRALSSGFQSYLAKPFDITEFITAIVEAAKINRVENNESVMR